MEPGNDPGRDEYGLPPVDIEIPDDARDLDRDVQAYYREVRARRRHVRIRRLTGPLTRHGMVLPLVAACLALTLLTGSLLTVLSGRQVPPMRNRLVAGPDPRACRRAGDGSCRAPWCGRPSQGHWVTAAQPRPGGAGLGADDLRCLRPGPQTARQAGRQERRPLLLCCPRPGRAAGPGQPHESDRTQYSRQIVNDTHNTLGSAYGLRGVTAIFAHGDGSVRDP